MNMTFPEIPVMTYAKIFFNDEVNPTRPATTTLEDFEFWFGELVFIVTFTATRGEYQDGVDPFYFWQLNRNWYEPIWPIRDDIDYDENTFGACGLEDLWENYADVWVEAAVVKLQRHGSLANQLDEMVQWITGNRDPTNLPGRDWIACDNTDFWTTTPIFGPNPSIVQDAYANLCL